ncbi:unnamed protein product, partial [Meganyctiphanes norvegica]
ILFVLQLLMLLPLRSFFFFAQNIPYVNRRANETTYTGKQMTRILSYHVNIKVRIIVEGHFKSLLNCVKGEDSGNLKYNLKYNHRLVINPAKHKIVFQQKGFLHNLSCWITPYCPQNNRIGIKAGRYYVFLFYHNTTSYCHRGPLKLKNNLNDILWDESWDEMAKYDIPAVIDYILETTKYQQLSYVGHSMGTTIFWAAMSENPDYNSKIKVMFGLGPVAFVGNMISPIRFLAPFVYEAQALLNLLGEYEFLPDNPEFLKWKELVCAVNGYKQIMCENSLFFLVGFDNFLFNKTLLPVIVGHEPEGTSTNTFIHFAQMVNTGNFQHFDYGLVGNMIHYKQAIPPLYNLSRVTAPVNLLWANNDWLADPKDAALLAQQLPNLQQNIEITFKYFNHLDFVWATDAYKLVNRLILKYLPFY